MKTPRLESRVATVAAARGLPTITAFTEASGMCRSTVASWWNRIPATLHTAVLCQLCIALNVGIGDLIVLVRQEETPDDNA